MFIKIINFFIKIHLTFVAEYILTLVSYIYGNRYKISHSNGFWILTDKINRSHFDFFIDPRTNLEEDVLKLYRDILLHKYTPKEGDIVVDIGAGLGHELLVLNESMNNTGKIMCIEALPVLIPGLRMNILRNNLTNCKVFNYAIGKNDHTFIELSNSSKNWLARSVFEENNSAKVKIPVITMDYFYETQGLKIIDFLCVNIEGAELDLIANFKYINQVKNISISCHDFLFIRNNALEAENYCTFDRIKQFLIKNNFDIETRNTGVDYKDFYVYGKNKSLI